MFLRKLNRISVSVTQQNQNKTKNSLTKFRRFSIYQYISSHCLPWRSTFSVTITSIMISVHKPQLFLRCNTSNFKDDTTDTFLNRQLCIELLKLYFNTYSIYKRSWMAIQITRVIVILYQH